MNSGYGEGEGRVSTSFDDALNSPLLNNNNAFSAKKILFNIYFSTEHPLEASEMNEIGDFMAKFRSNSIKLIWGTAIDDTLKGSEMKVTILASGFGTDNISPIPGILNEGGLTAAESRQKEEEEEALRGTMETIYGKGKVGQTPKPKPFIFRTVEQMADDEIIEALINHPAYNRTSKVMYDIVQKAEHRRVMEKEEAEVEFD
jgi:cell division protein FtsZ